MAPGDMLSDAHSAWGLAVRAVMSDTTLPSRRPRSARAHPGAVVVVRCALAIRCLTAPPKGSRCRCGMSRACGVSSTTSEERRAPGQEPGAPWKSATGSVWRDGSGGGEGAMLERAGIPLRKLLVPRQIRSLRASDDWHVFL